MKLVDKLKIKEWSKLVTEPRDRTWGAPQVGHETQKLVEHEFDQDSSISKTLCSDEWIHILKIEDAKQLKRNISCITGRDKTWNFG